MSIRQIVDDIFASGNRYVITDRDRPVAVMLSYDEYESLVETINILSDDRTMAAIAEGEAE